MKSLGSISRKFTIERASSSTREGYMYTELLGKLISNLWSLETVIRYFISIRLNESTPDIYEIEIGDEVEDSYFTNFKSLDQLIEKYNSLCSHDFQKIDKERVLDIRDLLAHGRIHVTDKIDANNWYLVKFSDPKKDSGKKIMLTHKVKPNNDSGAWIKESIKFISEQLHRVGKSGNFEIIQNKKTTRE